MNEAFHTVNLYELIWSYDTMNTCTADGLDTLERIKPNFSKRVLRHYQKTAQVLLDGLILTDCERNIGEHYDQMKSSLMSESQQSLFSRLSYGLKSWIKSLL